MSTRANIIIKDNDDKLFFYHHSDGYPEGVAPTLNKFMDLLKANKIRNNVSQSAGWLIILGAAEYNYGRNYSDQLTYRKPLHTKIDEFLPDGGLIDWKVGAYEPTTSIHGDIEYLYEIDLEAKTLKGWVYNMREGKKGEIVKIPSSEEKENKEQQEHVMQEPLPFGGAAF